MDSNLGECRGTGPVLCIEENSVQLCLGARRARDIPRSHVVTVHGESGSLQQTGIPPEQDINSDHGGAGYLGIVPQGRCMELE